ncbi:MAG: cation-transporting P-type ATPase, partial [Nitrospirae bacterium]|nr:cation-transporting P-type ATPase [Nitrospirota bacterium]
MGIHEIPAAQVYSVLRSHPEGLSDGEALQRLTFHGQNVLQAPARTSLFLLFLAKFTHFFALLLWVAAAIAFAAHRLGPGEGMQFLGGAIVAVIVINAVFSFWQEYRAERELEALARLLPLSVLVRRQNREVQVDAGRLVPGDLVFLAEGGRVPADVRILESHGLQVN